VAYPVKKKKQIQHITKKKSS